MTLTEFLLARIAEDAERAEFVRCQNEGPWHRPFETWRLAWQDEYDLLCIEPERVLLECDAKRQIILHAEALKYVAANGASILRLLALPYADHPDYQPEWQPAAA